MSKWSEQQIGEVLAAFQHRMLTHIDSGMSRDAHLAEHILDLRERAEKAEQRCAALESEQHATRATNADLGLNNVELRVRCAALEAALGECARWFDPRDTHGNFTNSEQQRARINAALSGDTSALREMLVKAILHATHGRYGKAWFDGHEREAADIAKRVMEGK